jgi:hypothetical protein
MNHADETNKTSLVTSMTNSSTTKSVSSSDSKSVLPSASSSSSSMSSLGWLAESSGRKRRKGKEIKMQHSSDSLVQLKAAVYAKQAQLHAGIDSSSSAPGQQSRRRKVIVAARSGPGPGPGVADSKGVYAKSNAGVAERDARQLQADQREHVDAAERMREKVALYEKFQRAGTVSSDSDKGNMDHANQTMPSSYLIDFERKQWARDNNHGSQSTEADSVTAPESYSITMNHADEYSMQQQLHQEDARIHWEMQARNEIFTNDSLSGATAATSSRPSVAPSAGAVQAYEHTLSENTKIQLEAISRLTKEKRSQLENQTLVSARMKRKQWLQQRKSALIATRKRRKLQLKALFS